ncbi:MAG TPA: PAS domain-containing protein, partial [Thermomicrobiales bacterium]|nr:PAS domain-containing protein [Thermomicrobiales bacterium]
MMQDQGHDNDPDGHRGASPLNRLGIGRLEWMILGLALIGIASAVLSLRVTSDELHRQSNRALIGAEMRHAVTSAHLWLEVALSGDTSVDGEADVFGNISYAESLGQLLLNGGDSGTTQISRIKDDELRADINEILDELALYRELSEIRWAELSAGSASSDNDDALNASYTRIMGHFEDGQARFEVLEEAGERRVRWIGIALIVFQSLVVAGIAVASNRSRARIRAQNSVLREQADALMVSQRRVEDAQQLARLGYIEWELGSNKAWWWSDELYRIYGFEPGEIVPTPKLMRQMIHAEDIAQVERTIGEAARSGVSQPLSYRMVRNDGEIRHLNGRLLLIPARDEQAARLVGTLQDVTDQKRVENELRRSRASLAAGQQIARLGTWDVDLKTNEAWWSEEVYRIIGVEPGAVEPSLDRYVDALYPDDRTAALQAIERIVATGEPLSIELRLPQPDGSLRPTQVAAEVFYDDDGQPARLIGAIQDITERKQIEDELRRNRTSLEAGQRIAQMGTLDWNVQTDEVWWSEEIDRIFGFERGTYEPSLEMFLDALHPDDRLPVEEAVRSALE